MVRRNKVPVTWGDQNGAQDRKPTTRQRCILPPGSMDLLSLGVHAPARPFPLALGCLVVPISTAARNVGVAEVGGCKPLHFTFCGAWEKSMVKGRQSPTPSVHSACWRRSFPPPPPRWSPQGTAAACPPQSLPPGRSGTDIGICQKGQVEPLGSVSAVSGTAWSPRRWKRGPGRRKWCHRSHPAAAPPLGEDSKRLEAQSQSGSESRSGH